MRLGIEVGDSVEELEVVAVVETDKVALDVRAVGGCARILRRETSTPWPLRCIRPVVT